MIRKKKKKKKERQRRVQTTKIIEMNGSCRLFYINFSVCSVGFTKWKTFTHWKSIGFSTFYTPCYHSVSKIMYNLVNVNETKYWKCLREFECQSESTEHIIPSLMRCTTTTRKKKQQRARKLLWNWYWQPNHYRNRRQKIK